MTLRYAVLSAAGELLVEASHPESAARALARIPGGRIEDREAPRVPPAVAAASLLACGCTAVSTVGWAAVVVGGAVLLVPSLLRLLGRRVS